MRWEDISLLLRRLIRSKIDTLTSAGLPLRIKRKRTEREQIWLRRKKKKR